MGTWRRTQESQAPKTSRPWAKHTASSEAVQRSVRSQAPEAIATRRGIGLCGASIATANLPSGPRMRRSQRPTLRRLARLSMRNQTEHAWLRRRKQRRGPFQPPASGILGQAVGHSRMLHPHACRLQGRTTTSSSRDQDQAVSTPTRCRAHCCPTCRLDLTANRKILRATRAICAARAEETSSASPYGHDATAGRKPYPSWPDCSESRSQHPMSSYPAKSRDP